MKILLTGGGTGGHFYPIIAVAEKINEFTKKEKLLEAKLYYMAPDPFDAKMLFDNRIEFLSVPAGKMRKYFSINNILDTIKTFFGIISSIIYVFKIYPDVIFSKGGYASFPALVAGRLFKIPVMIHESDAVPGKVNKWAGKFARRIAVSFPEAVQYFPAEKTAITGNPIRENIKNPSKNGAYEFLGLNPNIPTIMVIGGSQGSQIINDTIIDALKDLVQYVQIIHQTGKANFDDIEKTSSFILEGSPFKDRYKPYPYLNDLAIKMASGISKIVISRAGSSIFEIASWKLPSILIPISDSNGDHQRKNAIAYASTGASIIIEENNLSHHVLTTEIKRILADENLQSRMISSASTFGKADSAELIAREIVNIALRHEE